MTMVPPMSQFEVIPVATPTSGSTNALVTLIALSRIKYTPGGKLALSEGETGSTVWVSVCVHEGGGGPGEWEKCVYAL